MSLRIVKLFTILPAVLIFIIFNVISIKGQVIFTEIMFDVPGSDYNDEFIEVYNLSAQAVDLRGWQFSDSSSGDFLADAGMGLLLQPQQYAVILDGSYFDNSAAYDEVIPDSVLIIKIDDNAFGSSGLSNSQSERLALIDASGHTVQVYHYSLDNEPGYSDEKIILTQDNEAANWGNSLRKGGTPGFRNSIAPYDFDLCLAQEALQLRPRSVIKSGQTVQIDLALQNCGLKTFEKRARISLWLDVQNDSLWNETEPLIFEHEKDLSLRAGRDTMFSIAWQAQQAGRFHLCARLCSSFDENNFNNFVQKELLVLESSETLVINEIKYLTAENEPQWLELLNTGDRPLCLLSWGIADQKDTVEIDSCVFIHSGQYKVFAADSGLSARYGIPDSLIYILPGLPYFNKSQDIVYLLNPALGWVEQLPYEQSWLEGESRRNPSLERINPALDSRLARNWGPCTAAANATPGESNSVFTEIKNSTLKLKVSPNPFSPDGDGFEDRTIISIESPASSARARVEIYDVLGRKVRTLLDNRYIGSQFNVAWDGRFANGRKVRMGIYIIYAQILNDRDGLIKEFKETVVVAGKL